MSFYMKLPELIRTSVWFGREYQVNPHSKGSLQVLHYWSKGYTFLPQLLMAIDTSEDHWLLLCSLPCPAEKLWLPACFWESVSCVSCCFASLAHSWADSQLFFAILLVKKVEWRWWLVEFLSYSNPLTLRNDGGLVI